ncbi:hypothetical protein BN132_732 [Cronobacter turicensis 564]|nr:hypothetical protein BN132_732 [Cronobacter turicensis 564]
MDNRNIIIVIFLNIIFTRQRYFRFKISEKRLKSKSIKTLQYEPNPEEGKRAKLSFTDVIRVQTEMVLCFKMDNGTVFPRV